MSDVFGYLFLGGVSASFGTFIDRMSRPCLCGLPRDAKPHDVAVTRRSKERVYPVKNTCRPLSGVTVCEAACGLGPGAQGRSTDRRVLFLGTDDRGKYPFPGRLHLLSFNSYHS